jgi:hypothetical protein
MLSRLVISTTTIAAAAPSVTSARWPGVPCTSACETSKKRRNARRRASVPAGTTTTSMPSVGTYRCVNGASAYTLTIVVLPTEAPPKTRIFSESSRAREGAVEEGMGEAAAVGEEEDAREGPEGGGAGMEARRVWPTRVEGHIGCGKTALWFEAAAPCIWLHELNELFCIDIPAADPLSTPIHSRRYDLGRISVPNERWE